MGVYVPTELLGLDVSGEAAHVRWSLARSLFPASSLLAPMPSQWGHQGRTHNSPVRLDPGALSSSLQLPPPPRAAVRSPRPQPQVG